MIVPLSGRSLPCRPLSCVGDAAGDTAAIAAG
nr:MAG TPA: hypothetical protein [Caudoviricetes sp.]